MSATAKAYTGGAPPLSCAHRRRRRGGAAGSAGHGLYFDGGSRSLVAVGGRPASPVTDLETSMVLWAERGEVAESRALWLELIHSTAAPGAAVAQRLIEAYARTGQFEELARVAGEAAARGCGPRAELFSAAVRAIGGAGQLEMMETALEEMASQGIAVDSATGNAVVSSYSRFGTLSDVDGAYRRLKRWRVLVERDAIRSVAAAYIARRKFYLLGEFLRDVGLGRRNVGNLLWNLLLLSYAANFKMKSLQREFLGMTAAGFSPDLTTFNIRALAFARMGMVWDLHLGFDHMAHLGVQPDLVTCGSVVDLYVDRRLALNLPFALGKMDLAGRAPRVATDPLVFEVFGKGDFHAGAEALLQSAEGRRGTQRRRRRWSYSDLVSFHLKKQYRSNQVIWNY
ncbi:pentatricopeptide repeat (PPR) superfamily protein [Wolffia australiana]